MARIALFKVRGVLIVQDGDAALIGFNGAAIVVIVHPESAAVVGLHGEVAPVTPEVVTARAGFTWKEALPWRRTRRVVRAESLRERS